MTELEEYASETFGFRQLASKGGIKLFDSAVDFSSSPGNEYPLQLLDVGHVNEVYAASNTSSVGVGKLRDLDDESIAKSNFIAVPFAGVSFLKFNSSNDYLYVVAGGQLFKAAVDDLFDRNKSAFQLIETKGYVTQVGLHFSEPDVYFYTTSDNLLVVSEDGQTQEHANSVCGAWNPHTSELGTITKSSFQLGSINLSAPEFGELLYVSCLNKNSWYLVGFFPDADEMDPIHILVTISKDGKPSWSLIPVLAPVSFVERPPTIYCSTIVDWIKNTTHSFLTYSLSIEISTLEIADMARLVVPVNDSDRAELPMDDDMGDDTLPVGFAVDLSGKNVAVPAPSTSIELADGVLPRIICLNNQGCLLMWHSFDSDGINKGNASLQRPLEHKVLFSSPNSASKFPDKPTYISEPSKEVAEPLIESNRESSSSEQLIKGSLSSSFGNVDFGSSSVQSKATTGLGFGKMGFGGVSLEKFGGETSDSGKSGSNALGSKLQFGSTGFGAMASQKLNFVSSGFGTQSSQPSSFGQFASASTSSPFGKVSQSGDIFGSTSSSPFGKLNENVSIFGASSKTSATDKITPTFLATPPANLQPITSTNSNVFGLLPSKINTNQKELSRDSTDMVSNSTHDIVDQSPTISGITSHPDGHNYLDSKSQVPFYEKKDENDDKDDEDEEDLEDEEDDEDDDDDEQENKDEPQLQSEFGLDSKSELDNGSKLEFANVADLSDIAHATEVESKSQVDKIHKHGTDADDGPEVEDKKEAETEVGVVDKDESVVNLDIGNCETKDKTLNSDQVLPQETVIKEPHKLTLNEVIAATEFVRFGGYSGTHFVGKDLPGQMIELIQLAQAQLDVFQTNVEVIEKLITAYLEKNPEMQNNDEDSVGADEALIEANKEPVDTSTGLLEDSSSSKKCQTEWTLANILDLKKEISTQRGEIDGNLEAAETLQSQIRSLMTDLEGADSVRKELQKVLDEMSSFSRSLVSSKFKERPMSIQAEHLKLSIRRNLVRVQELHDEVLQKLLPFGVKMDLGNNSAERIDKMEAVARQISAMARVYSDELLGLETEFNTLTLKQSELEGSEKGPVRFLRLPAPQSPLQARIACARKFGAVLPKAVKANRRDV